MKVFLKGIEGRQKNICALKGSSVDLPCSAERPTSSMKWYTVHRDGPKFIPKEISPDENHVTYNMLEERNFTLTIKDLTESDAKAYCCKETTDTPDNCKQSEIQLHVADLQVKVIPTTEGQTVTLICNTSCPLTENSTVYIWYKNREFLYQDWSPWYHQLVSSEEAVTYSCAIKGYEHLRAPEVSVDSVTSTCISVTYAKGTMCSHKQSSVDQPCSITYPTEVHIQRTPADRQDHVTLTCNTSCPLTPIIWYKSRRLLRQFENHQNVVLTSSAESFSCAVKGLEDLRSAEVCAEDTNCWTVNYVSRRICALEGSSVNISSKYYCFNLGLPKSKSWYKVKRSGEGEVEEPLKAVGRVKYHDTMKNRHILGINNLKKYDSAEYRFKLQTDDGWKPGVTLVVTGSSVDLPCSAERPTSSMKWYTVHRDGPKFIPKEISPDENHVTYNMLEERNFTLTIKDLTESDAKVYCCKETTSKPEKCKESEIQLHVADLQVKVIPTTEGQTVTLICNTSCPLTENPAVYIWYKNNKFLYQDWSPWYHQLVSSEEAVTYSCAIKGYEHLRAPKVSVDSVTSTCISVTYAKGTMCSHEQSSVDQPCSITYPTEVHIQRTPADRQDHVTLTCNTSCPLTPIIWYKSRHLLRQFENHQNVVLTSSAESFSCAVKGLEDLRSAEVCAEDTNCRTVNYVSRRICALEGSSVNISSEYSNSNYGLPKSKSWYKVKRSVEGEVEEPIKAVGRVKYHDNMKNRHILGINNLKKYDSAEYLFKLQTDDRWKPGVTLVVTGLKVKFVPSAVVTEGQRVTLTCISSCPLPDNTTCIWFLNSRPLTPTENQNKHLVLNPVSSQHAGNYSCAVKTPQNTTSREKTLTVKSKTRKRTPAAAAGVCAALLLLIPLAVFLWIRRKRTSSQSPRNETSDNLEQLNPDPLYGNVSAQTTEQDELHYSSVHFSQNHTDPLYSTVQPHPPHKEEHVPYAVVKFRRNMTPEHDSQAVDT
ncbi:hypothetical protein ABVT39_009616 [Epinephelus coioides]